jgi:hypothetical protein
MAFKPKPTTSEPPRETPARSSKYAEPKIEQRGKRGDPLYSQISGLIPTDLRRRFKAKAAMEDKDLSTVLEAIIREYVDEERRG